MDESTIRSALTGLRDELAQHEGRREILISLVRNYEALLRYETMNKRVPAQAIPAIEAPAPPIEVAKAEDASPSFRGAVLKVLRDAKGAPLQARELHKRVEALGARTTSPHPLSVVALAVRSLSKSHPIEKTGPRTWRWTGE